MPEIERVLNSTTWYKSLPFARKPKVDFVDPKDVNRVVDTTGELNSPQDITPMGLANLGLDIIDNGSTAENVLQRLSRTLSI